MEQDNKATMSTPENEGMAPIRTLLNTVKSKKISTTNYNEIFNEVRQSAKTILTMLGGKVDQYNGYISKLNDLRDDDGFADTYKQGFVSVEIYEVIRKVNSVQREIVDWRAIYSELVYEMLIQSKEIFDVNKAIEIESKALERMEKNLAELYRINSEAMDQRTRLIDERVLNTLRIMDENNKRYNEYMQDKLVGALLKISNKSKVEDVDVGDFPKPAVLVTELKDDTPDVEQGAIPVMKKPEKIEVEEEAVSESEPVSEEEMKSTEEEFEFGDEE